MSVCLIRPKKLYQYLIFTSVTHSGAAFSASNLGTIRSGAIVAGTWTAMMKTGLSGYISKLKEIHKTTLYLREGVKQNPDLKLFGPNNSYNMVCFDTPGLNPISVSLKMKEQNHWKLSECQLPNVLHLLISESNYKMGDKFLKDIKEAIAEVRAKSNIKISSYQTLYGATTIVTDKAIQVQIFNIVIDCCFETTLKRAKMGMDA
mmetsp:Transcript_26358/g.30480  ORF Transcript_26358/g.30480 Transcript_26358/m.30480 type:complete len:204 (-) Transcript_26358:38-649(-)